MQEMKTKFGALRVDVARVGFGVYPVLGRPFFTASSNVGMRASGFNGATPTVRTGKPMLRQETPTKVNANRPAASRVKRSVLMTRCLNNPFSRYHACR